MRISDWSSDVCSSDLVPPTYTEPRWVRGTHVWSPAGRVAATRPVPASGGRLDFGHDLAGGIAQIVCGHDRQAAFGQDLLALFHIGAFKANDARNRQAQRSEGHTSELQSLMRIQYAGLCLKNK